MKKISTAALSLFMAALLVILSACSGKNTIKGPKGVPKVDPEVTITMDDGNVIKLVLYSQKAPNTVCNFVSLSKSGYYDGLTFHRAAKDFVIQGGDAKGDGSGEAGFTIQGEFEENGFDKNDILHEEGVISMARTEDFDSAATQFFIVTQTSRNVTSALDGKYAAFGKVTSGIEAVHTYENRNVNNDTDQRPYDIPKIKTVTVDTKGADFPEPIRNGEALPRDYVKNPTTAPTTSAAPTTTPAPTTTAPTTSPAPTTTEDNSKRMTATITMEDGSKIVLALYPEKAPNTVQNFVDLCNQKFYDGLIFHRVLQGFMIQTGDKTGSGRGDNGWTIKGEFKDNGYTDNDLSYDAGVVGMARINEQNDTASSQFFITDTGNNKSALDGKYAAFAKVIEGMDVVRKISAVVVGKNPEIANDEENASPVEKQIIKTITVDTKGVNVPAPERITAAQ